MNSLGLTETLIEVHEWFVGYPKTCCWSDETVDRLNANPAIKLMGL